MSLKSKIEAVIYASEEPVTLAQLAGLLGDEASAEIAAEKAAQELLPMDLATDVVGEPDTAAEEAADEVADEAAVEAAVETEAGVGDQHAGAAADDTPADEALLAAVAEADKKRAKEEERAVRELLKMHVDKLIAEYAESDRGIEVREVAGGYRMGTKPEYHDAVRGFIKSLKPPMKLSLQALETLAVVAYKQPVTAAEIGEIRGVDSAGVLGGLMTRKLIATAGRKSVVGRPMLYKTTKEFLVRFGLKDVQELPSMEEFERMAGELAEQEDLPMEEGGEVAALDEPAGEFADAAEVTEESVAAVAPPAEDEPVKEHVLHDGGDASMPVNEFLGDLAE